MTNLAYLENTYLFESDAIIEKVEQLEDGRIAIQLDTTIFYPQGGGQPCDIGTINSATTIFNVTDVRMDPNGVVYHFGNFKNGQFSDGERVKLVIDKNRRIQNAKAHSAGHLIDCGVILLKFPLQVTKGYHFADGPYVEYKGEIDTSEETIKKIQQTIESLVAKNIDICVSNLSTEQANKLGMNIPLGKTARMVSFSGFEGCGCGGTHVRNSAEIGKIIIRKIKTKKGTVKICYEVS